MKLFLGFVAVSGIGWVLDFLSYTFLTQVVDLAPAYANFTSSMVGITYVWIVALNRLFDRGNYGKSIFLPIYLGYQATSIFIYSALISIVAASRFNVWFSQLLMLPIAITAKIFLTPINLSTNFIFMSFLTKFMKTSSYEKILK